MGNENHYPMGPIQYIPARLTAQLIIETTFSIALLLEPINTRVKATTTVTGPAFTIGKIPSSYFANMILPRFKLDVRKHSEAEQDHGLANGRYFEGHP